MTTRPTSTESDAAGACVPGPVGGLLARAYGAAVRRRNVRFDQGIGVVRLDRPVISVGNLSVGGTGKTPVVMWLARALREAGRRPCIAMRGYRAGAHGSDEAAEYGAELPGVPVVARPDRAAALREFFATESGRDVDSVVLDDGFQHRRIARDLDIVLLDATRDPFADRLLPAGWLREPVESLGRAGAIVITRADRARAGSAAALASRARDIAGPVPVAVSSHSWSGLRVVDHGSEAERALDWLAARSCWAAVAIGNPAPFLAQARERCRGVLGATVLRDHDPFSRRTVRRIISAARAAGAQAILTTGKDWTKLARVPANEWPCPVVRPRLEIVFERGEDDLLRAALAAATGAGSFA